MSDWLDVLRAECAASSQSKVAAQLRQGDGFPSKAFVSLVLNDKYPRAQGLGRLQKLVEARYMSEPEPAQVDEEEWIAVLRRECERSSQSKVAAMIRLRLDGFPSPTIINQVLNGKYPSAKGRARLRDLVRGRFMGETVDCPVESVIGLHKCVEYQSLPYSNCNPIRAQLYSACRRCPNRREEQ